MYCHSNLQFCGYYKASRSKSHSDHNWVGLGQSRSVQGRCFSNGLYVCFHFLKTIGQHVESAGLNNMWSEAGLYPKNTIETMLNGKGYYRTVTHTLTFEGLWWYIVTNKRNCCNWYFCEVFTLVSLLTDDMWSTFCAWSDPFIIQIFADVEEATEQMVDAFRGFQESARESVELLSDFISESKICKQFEQFEKRCASKRSYAFWKSYPGMIKSCLTSLKRRRKETGNCTWRL